MDPLALLEAAVTHLHAQGCVIVSVPNAVHWSVRGQVLAGRFDYTNQGLLDRGHLRFFTCASAERLFDEAGLCVVERRGSPVPWERILPDALGGALRASVERADHALTRAAPNLFAYQHIYALKRADSGPVAEHPDGV